MHTSSLNIINELRGAGKRITRTRKFIVELLDSSKHPLAASDLILGLKKLRNTVNKTTVYRELESLRQSGVVRVVNLLDGHLRYELTQNADFHPHIVCTSCNKIKCLPIESDLRDLRKRVAKAVNFDVTGHILEFFGKCSSCK